MTGAWKVTGSWTIPVIHYTRVCQLFQRHDAVSVYLYDREYRKPQAQLLLRWGTEVTHLQAMWLKEQDTRSTRADSPITSTKTTPPRDLRLLMAASSVSITASLAAT